VHPKSPLPVDPAPHSPESKTKIKVQAAFRQLRVSWQTTSLQLPYLSNHYLKMIAFLFAQYVE